MGEIVMEVVERVIGREVNAEAHRDLIDEAVAALRADTAGGAAAAGTGATVSEPSAPGVHGRRGRGGRRGRARGAWRPTWKRSSSSSWATRQLRAALTDTAVPGPARRAVILDLLDGKVLPAARRLAAFACRRGRRPRGPASRSAGSAPTGATVDEGQDEEPGLSLLQSRAPGRRLRRGRVRGHVDRRARVARGRPVPLRPDRGLHAGPARRRCPIATSTSAARQGLVDAAAWRARCRPRPCRWPATCVTGGRARDIVGTLDFLVEQTAQARGWRIAHVRAAAPIDDASSETSSPSRSARWPAARRAAGGRSTSRCSAAR